MRTRKMINLMAGLFFTGILCLNGGASGYVPSDEACPASEVVFIDPSVPEIEKIVAQLPQGAEAVRLLPWRDGVGQISAHLAKKRNLSAIHIISHGNAGHFVLNGKRIDGDFLREYGHGISGWGRSLAESGDILLYACNLAATDEGKAFVGKFADVSRSDVAASIDNTGSNIYDGDWELEYRIGVIETTKFVMGNSYEYILPTTRVVTTSSDSDSGSLRAAIDSADSGDTITFDADYTIVLLTSININVNISIDGAGHIIVVDSNSTFPPFIIGGSSAVTFSTLTLEDDGGAGAVIQDDSSGLLTLTDVTLKGNVDSDGGDGGVTVTGELTLTGSVTIDTDRYEVGTSGDINVTGTVEGATSNTQDLTLDAGPDGTISVTGAIGGGTSLKHLTVANSAGATFTGDVTTGTSIILTNTTDDNNITFSGNLVTQTLTTEGEGYYVELHGGCTITNHTSFSNTGTTTIGNDSSDSSTFTGGLDATAGPVSIAGTVATTNTAMDLGATTVSDDSTINPAGGEVALASATIIDAKTLIVGTGNTGEIWFDSTINSAAGGAGNLTINTDDTAYFSNSVGGTTAIGTLTLTAGTVSAGTNSITAGTITVNGGTFGLAASPSGAWDVGNVTISSGATMNAPSGVNSAFNVSGDWSNSGTFNHKDGTVTFDGTDQALSGSTTFHKLTKNVTAAATLTFPSGTTTTVENTLNLSGASGQLLSLISSSPGTQWEINPQGTRTIAYLDVKDSNNINGAAIDAVGTNSVSSGNNTNWTFVTAGTYYVDIQNGSDSNAGTAAAPWKTLHYAIDQINGGAAGTYILIMAAGTYSTDNGEAIATLIISQSDVTIFGADHHTIGTGTTLIDGTGTSTDDWVYGINTTGSNITIKDLSIKNFSATGQHGIYMSASTETEVYNCKISNNDTGIHIAAGSNAFKIEFCEIHSNNKDGVYVNHSTDGEIYRNTIHTHQTTDAEGIYVNGCSPAIKRNKIYDNITGIKVYANSAASPYISNNIIYETTDNVMNYGIRVYSDSGTASPTIYHNTIDGGSGDGIAIEMGSTSTIEPVIKYNIITRCDVYGIDDGVGVPSANIAYNDVWGNTNGNYHNCAAGTGGISEDPENGPTEFKLPSDSPCINTIPATDPPGDPVTIDYYGYTRPGGTTSTSKDMGACEYIATRTDSYTLPGGSGLETDYDIFTVPLYIGTGQDMRNTMESTLGAYDPTHWRVFARTTSGDIEMNTSAFASLDIKPGMGFWGITVLTNAISFQGTLAPDAIYYVIELAPGWHLFAVPWPGTNINLGKIYVTDGVNQYVMTDASNTLTQQKIWDYTGTGPTNGYVERNTDAFSLAAGTGYFIKVLGSSNIIVAIPPNNSSDPPYNSSTPTLHAMSYESLEPVGLTDDPEPPPLPGGSYGPVPSIRANELGDNMTVTNGTPVSIAVSLDPGDQVNKNADWWVVAHTPFDSPLDWYSYVHPEGWQPGIYPCVQTPLFQVPPSFEVLNMALPPGGYTFYFAVDENMDGIVDETWVDSVDVRVE